MVIVKDRVNSIKLILDIETKIAIFEKDFTEKFNTFATEKDTNLKTVLLAEFVRDILKT